MSDSRILSLGVIGRVGRWAFCSFIELLTAIFVFSADLS